MNEQFSRTGILLGAEAVEKLARSRVSVAFRKAKRPQAAIIAEPPLDTKGSVTPVNGSRSTVPNTFSTVCTMRIAATAQAPMV